MPRLSLTRAVGEAGAFQVELEELSTRPGAGWAGGGDTRAGAGRALAAGWV